MKFIIKNGTIVNPARGQHEQGDVVDEAFAMYDDERLEQTLRSLSGFENQIFIFTCQTREAEMLSKMNIDYHLIRL